MAVAVPYVTTAELIEYPTFLDLISLKPGPGAKSATTPILNKILLIASGWCDSYCDMGVEGTLAAHTRVENKRLRPDKYGRLLWRPDHIPLISVQSVAYGTRIGALTTYTAPPVFVEDERNCIVDLQAGNTTWSGSLQFGLPRSGTELYTTWSYLAGYPNTLLSAPVTAGATLLPVTDAIGIIPGQTLAIYDPGQDETVTVSLGWVPTIGPASVPLTTGLVSAHTINGPVRVSAMEEDILQATIFYTIAQLMRPDAYPDMYSGLSATGARMTAPELITLAEEMLFSYRRTT